MNGLLVLPNGTYHRVEPETAALSVFGMRKNKRGEPVPNHSSLAHDPAYHDCSSAALCAHRCIEAWTTTVTTAKPEANPTAAALVRRIRCFSRYAPTYCWGPVLFVRWGGNGEGLPIAVLDVLERMIKEGIE